MRTGAPLRRRADSAPGARRRSSSPLPCGRLRHAPAERTASFGGGTVERGGAAGRKASVPRSSSGPSHPHAHRSGRWPRRALADRRSRCRDSSDRRRGSPPKRRSRAGHRRATPGAQSEGHTRDTPSRPRAPACTEPASMMSAANFGDTSAGWPANAMKLLVDGSTAKITRAARSFMCLSTPLPSTCPPGTCGS